jgi:hypothetical protein
MRGRTLHSQSSESGEKRKPSGYGQMGERKFTYGSSTKPVQIQQVPLNNQSILGKQILPDCVEYTDKLIPNPDKYFKQFMKDFKFEKRKAVTKDAPDGYYLRRYTCVFGDPQIMDKPPAIWGINNPVVPWTQELLEVKEMVEKKTGKTYNIALCNLYKKGTDMINWHSDKEERGSTASIASVSLGAERDFKLQSLTNPSEIYTIRLENGSLFEMKDPCQSLYQHCLPEDPKLFGARINITFRNFDSERYASF